MNNKKTVRIGFDLDGVIAQHSMGGFWVWLREIKEKILKKMKSPTYYYPSTILEKRAWMFIDGIKKPTVDQQEVLANLASRKEIQLYIVTGRFKFLEKLTRDWLEKYKFDCFLEVLINAKDIDPLIFKANTIRGYNLNFYFDDDLDVLNYLSQQVKARLYWVVPPHRGKDENSNPKIGNCENLIEKLNEVFSQTNGNR